MAIYERSITDIKEYRSSSSSSDSAAAPVEELSVADQDSVWELQSLIAKRIINNLLCFQQPTTHHHPVINRFRIQPVK